MENIFLNLDNNQCYLLGYIINNVLINFDDTNFDFEIDLKSFSLNNKEIVIRLINVLTNGKWGNNYNKIIIKSDILSKNYFNLLNPDISITNDNKENIYNFPSLSQKDDELFWSFIRGYFEKNGVIVYNNNIPKCVLRFCTYSFMNDFIYYVGIPYSKQINIFEQENELTIEYVSTNCIDFLGSIYKNKKKNYNEDIFNKFQTIMNWKFINSLNSLNNTIYKLDICKVFKSDSNAIIPFKSKESDVGYDLTIIKEYKTLTPSTKLYDTGIKLEVDYGYYIEIVPRSSISKSGYILSNSIGIIEKSYTGTLLVSLTKIDKEMPDIKLPFKCCQILFKPQVSMSLIEVNAITETVRNSGGFGSSDEFTF